ncbi:DUF3515 domain-containing protein [Actinocorallia populi]|uniref:DUF3515 domain-containing protein n=1 Tax=Actinocorallia populi TaxID=2079200 RepID=UPI001E608AA6|nr:DUF3515 domain-containing protein [Actinocorallia populi]
MRRPLKRGALLGSATAAILAATACSGGPVRVAEPTPDPAAAQACRELRLPAEVDGLQRRETDPETPYVAVWGSPPLALRCGVPRPSDPDSGLIERVVAIDGLEWLPEESDQPRVWTLVGRAAYVEVTIPPKYAPAGSPPGELLTEFTPALDKLPKKPEGQY